MKTPLSSRLRTDGRDAKDVTLTDESFDAPNSGFTRVSGLPSVKFAEIAAGSNVSHHIVVQSSYPGYYNLSAASVAYYASDEASVETVKSLSMCVMDTI